MNYLIEKVNRHNKFASNNRLDINGLLESIFNDNKTVAFVLDQRDKLQISIYSSSYAYIRKNIDLAEFISILIDNDIEHVNGSNIIKIGELLEKFYDEHYLNEV